jgi:tetratricopeptide (TPR) repeat protein
MTSPVVPSSVVASAGLSAQNPWPGLRAFTESDREFFFGREAETAKLLGIFKRSSVVILYGQSGLGKTSLLQAGLFPELKLLDYLPLRLRFDHSENALPLAQQIKLALAGELDRAEIKAPRPGSDETLWEYFHRRDVDFWGQRNRLLIPAIVLDQFEEVFTLGQKDDVTAARVAQFASELESLIEHRAPDHVRERLEQRPDEALHYDFQRQSVKLLLSLREDFLPQLDPWRSRMPSLLQHRFRLERMTGAQALTVVERAGRDLVDPEVAQEIVDFVSTSQRQRVSRAVEQRDVEPALLSVVCDELNRRRIERGQARINVDLLTGERQEIIQRFYERAFEGLDERVRDWVENELLTASGYRDRAAIEDALKQGLPESDFDLLVDRRVLHREERQGVVWLELTHDLLSDPAAQSRAIREAKASAKREAEVAKQLRRTRQWAMVFAALLLAMVSAFVYMFMLQHRMHRAEEKVDAMVMAEIERKAQAEGAEIKAKAAAAVNDQIQSIDGFIKSVTDLLARNRDMRLTAPTVRWIVGSADQSLKNLDNVNASNQKPPSIDSRLQQAKFLAEAGESLRAIGDFRQGAQKAEGAIQSLDSMPSPPETNEPKREEAQFTRAQALYVRGECRLAMGDLTGAGQDFEQSSTLATEPQEGAWKEESNRILVLSKIALGEIDVKKFAQTSASQHFAQALSSIRNLPAREESNLWKAMALDGLALVQTDDAVAEQRLDEANRALGGEGAAPGVGLRRKRLFAEIAYQRGVVAYRLDKSEEADGFFERADAASEELHKIDPDNLDWHLSQLQNWRGEGLLHMRRGEWEAAQQKLSDTEKGASELLASQPSWVQARFLRGAAVYTQGTLILRRSSAPANLDRAAEKYALACQLLQDSVQGAPRNLGMLAGAISSRGDIYYRQSSDSNLSPTAKTEKLNQAMQLYEQARQVLSPIQSTQKDSIASYDRESADTLMALDKPGDAIGFYDKAVAIRAEAAKKAPTADNENALSDALESLGEAYVRNKENAKAGAEYTLASECVERALKERPRDIEFLRQKADVHAAMFDKWRVEGDLPRALEEMDTALAVAWSALQEDYSNKALDDLNRYRGITERTVKELGTAAKPSGNPDPPTGEWKALTPQQSEAMAAKMKTLLAKYDPTKLLGLNQQRAWILAPLVPGSWRNLGSTELQSARSQLLAAKPSLAPEQILGMRKLPVDFYDGAVLYEAEIQLGNGKRGIVSYLQRGAKPAVVLDGWKDRINDINRDTPPRLDTVERATAYLRFFTGATQNEHGRFMLVDQLEELHWLPATDQETRDKVAQKIKPLAVQPSHDGGWRGIGTIPFSGSLVYAAFQLSRVGEVFITIADTASEENFPFTGEGFSDGIRGPYTEEMGIERLEANPDSTDAVQKLPARYFKVKRFKDAAQAQQKLLDSIKGEGQRSERLAAYTTLAWYQLWAGEFKEALASAEAGKKLDESSLALDIYRADALFFLGRTQEEETVSNEIEAGPNAQALLEDRATLCSGLKRWKDAVDAQGKLITFIQQHAKSDEERRKNLPGPYLSLSWYQLMSRDFDGALASTEAGRKIDPSYLPLETNRAHALMFLGRTPEAEAIYLHYAGRNFFEGSDKSWQQIIFEDFDDLEKQGVTSPEMAHVRTLLKPPAS